MNVEKDEIEILSRAKKYDQRDECMMVPLWEEVSYIFVFVLPIIFFVAIVSPFGCIVDSLTVVSAFLLWSCKGQPRLCMKGVETIQQES